MAETIIAVCMVILTLLGVGLAVALFLLVSLLRRLLAHLEGEVLPTVRALRGMVQEIGSAASVGKQLGQELALQLLWSKLALSPFPKGGKLLGTLARAAWSAFRLAREARTAAATSKEPKAGKD